MSDWTEGYVADVDYTFGYYSELNPLRVNLPFLNVGLAPPEIGTACELGFGQGISVNIHAAASDVAWYGTDFNPVHAAFAQSLAAAAGSGARLFDQSFAEFCARADLPDFDFIALHGIWSWISPDNQRVIVDFVRRKLKLGGVLYISYNCQPGHAATVPLRHLLAQHAEVMAPPGGGRPARIAAAIEFAEKLLALNTAFGAVHPTIADRLKAIKGQDRNYLAHEYFNRDWHAAFFAEIAASLEPAKLTYACSAHYLEHIEGLQLSAEQRRFLADIPDPMFRESVHDFMVNQQFRRDYWVKGPHRLPGLEQAEAVRRLRVMLLAGPRSEIPFTMQGLRGPVQLNAGVYAPLLDVLDDRRPKTVGEIEQALSRSGIGLGAIFEGLMLLAGREQLSMVQTEEVQQKARPHTDGLNRRVIEGARSSGAMSALASPVTGGGVLVGLLYQLFLLARSHGRRTVEELAQSAWELMAAQGQRMIKDGRALETPEQNLVELLAQARDFSEHRLPLFQALQIA
jgi:SAM-dependent methyltransferase